MTLRNSVLGLAVIFGFSVWSVWAACRPCGQQAHAQGAETIIAADVEGAGSAGTHDESIRRYRNSQSTHWRQVAIGR